MTLIHSNISSYAQYAFLKEGSCIAMLDSQSINKQNWELLSDTKDILGYRCKKARTSINSNTIEIYYTDEMKIKGGPSILGTGLGFVFEMVRNGNYRISAIGTSKERFEWPAFLKNVTPEYLEKIDYNDRIWRSRFITIPVFNHQQICFTDGP